MQKYALVLLEKNIFISINDVSQQNIYIYNTACDLLRKLSYIGLDLFFVFSSNDIIGDHVYTFIDNEKFMFKVFENFYKIQG